MEPTTRYKLRDEKLGLIIANGKLIWKLVYREWLASHGLLHLCYLEEKNENVTEV